MHGNTQKHLTFPPFSASNLRRSSLSFGIVFYLLPLILYDIFQVKVISYEAKSLTIHALPKERNHSRFQSAVRGFDELSLETRIAGPP